MSAESIIERIRASKPAMVVIIVVAALLAIGLVDGIANMGKAYGNVSINGMSVAGMTEDGMRDALQKNFGERMANTSITINAADSTESSESSASSDVMDERDILAQLVAAEYSDDTRSWAANSESLRASLDYDDAIRQAMDAGRQGGPFGRLAVLMSPADIPLQVNLDDGSVNMLADNIDKAIGVQRVDATVIVDEGGPRVLPGHDGDMVDRDWLVGELKGAFLSEQQDVQLVAAAKHAPSRTTSEQAQAMCDAIERALNTTATFSYRNTNWTAGYDEYARWTVVSVVPKGEGYELQASIDDSVATHDLIEGIGTQVASDDVTVSFDVRDNGIVVYTNGSGSVPEIAPALEALNQQLYGPGGLAFNSSANTSLNINVAETDAPESMTFDEAVGFGIVSVIGEYETKFSNDAGTENRNHNIALVADILNNSIATANGGTWSFNEHSGDTNQDPPFASAGSIVNGEYVDSIGGGICQVATTVFNAVYEAGLDIDQRWNHSLYIASYPEGRDASVSYPDLDLVWSNPLPSDVLLKLEHTDTSVTARLYGVYTGYHVESELGQWEQGAKYSTRFETDDSLSSGMAYQKSYGENGSKISVTRKVYDANDNLLKENVYTSNYAAKDEVYVVGPGTDTSAYSRSTSANADAAASAAYDASIYM